MLTGIKRNNFRSRPGAEDVSALLPEDRWTHPVSGADSLVVDPITLVWQQGSVPVTIVGPVITCTHTHIHTHTHTHTHTQVNRWTDHKAD